VHPLAPSELHWFDNGSLNVKLSVVKLPPSGTAILLGVIEIAESIEWSHYKLVGGHSTGVPIIAKPQRNKSSPIPFLFEIIIRFTPQFEHSGTEQD
jgi:hypothetical protein